MARLGDPRLEAYARANNALLGLIRGERANSRSPRQRRRRAEAKLLRARALLRSLGDPQHQYAVIHVTGTSGKGSTSAAIAAILSAAGYRTGLRTSPYLQVATEKLQIGPSLIDGESFDRMVQLVLAQNERLPRCGGAAEPASYAEVWAALSLTWFAERAVDIAVVEVGAGGRFDSTNAVSPVVSVITSVGLDHVVSLGPTIADIAWHKAGIIKPGATTVVGALPTEAMSVVASIVRAQDAPLMTMREPPANVAIPAGADFQRQNACLAYTVIAALRERGFTVPDTAIAAGLTTGRLPGRYERMPAENPSVWLDGAHNADKMAALAAEISQRHVDHQLPVVVLGVLGAKDATSMITKLRGVASVIVATEPRVVGKRALPASSLAELVSRRGFDGLIVCEPDVNRAVGAARELAHEGRTDVIVTGSLYLVGEVRSRWYPNDEIVAQRTAWPDAALRPISSVA